MRETRVRMARVSRNFFLTLGWCNMRAEVKVALIVGFIAIAGGGIWWFNRAENELDELPIDKSVMDATSERDASLARNTKPSPGSPTAKRPTPAGRPGDRATKRTTPIAQRPIPEATGPKPAPIAPQPRPGTGRPGLRPKPTAEKPESTEPAKTDQKPGLPPLVGEPKTVDPGPAKPSVSPTAGPTGQPAKPPTEADRRTTTPDLTPRPRLTPTTPLATPGRTYAIQAGDTLIHIARDEYGDDNLWKAIKAANPGLDETRLKIGQKIKIPSKAEAQRLAGAAAKPMPSVTRPETPTGTTQPPTGRATYVVGRGDSLIKIARNVLKDDTRWKEIYDLNRDKLESPDELRIGMELKLPPLKPARG